MGTLFFLKKKLSERIIYVLSSDFVWENLIVFISSVSMSNVVNHPRVACDKVGGR